MTEAECHPTPHPEVNALLADTLGRVRAILGDRLVGMYLFGSLAAGDFDAASDVDVLVVTDDEVPGDLFRSLDRMHEGIKGGGSRWAVELEASYIPRQALRRYDPSRARHPHIDRGAGERLHQMDHHSDWIVQRHVVRERGLTLAGPPPATLIDPIAPDSLRWAMIGLLRSWIAPLLSDPPTLETRGYQSYLVLTMCRILYTLEHGTVASKVAAARWARETLASPWASLIDGALVGRLDPRSPSDPDEVARTLELLRHTADVGSRRRLDSDGPAKRQ